ncbi:putative death-receptor fusion protein-domain-containing protein [Phakopsora pachyrhizi]|nr:putative death-receptor fusion protein-domain-containing protein [Phakopsora pachyrhizi]
MKDFLDYVTVGESDPAQSTGIKFFLDSIRKTLLIEKRSLAILTFILPYLKWQEVLPALNFHPQTAPGFLRVILAAIGDEKLAFGSGQLAVQWTCTVEGWNCKAGDRHEFEAEKRCSDWALISSSILFSPDERQQQYLCQYYFLPLFKLRPSCFEDLAHQINSSKLSPSSVNSFEYLSGLVALARIKPWTKGKLYQQELITEKTLKDCLLHPSVSLRSSALSIICQSKSPTSPILSENLELIFEFFYHNFGEVDPELKQIISSNLNVLVNRLRDSSWACNKKILDLKKRYTSSETRPDKAVHSSEQEKSFELLICEHKAYLELVKGFTERFTIHCRMNFTLLSPYRNQMASLRYLKLFLDAGVDPGYRPDIDGSELKLPRFPFELNIFTKSFIKDLVIGLTSTYSDIRMHAFSFLKSCTRLESGFLGQDDLWNQIMEYAVQCIDSSRESETCTATLLLRLVLEKKVYSGRCQVPPMLKPKLTEGQLKTPIALFLQGRLNELEGRVVAAENKTAHACQRLPAQGSLMIISELFKSLSPSMLKSLIYSGDLANMLRRARDLIKRVWGYSSRVLCFPAPEGNNSEKLLNMTAEEDHEEFRAQEIMEEAEEDFEDNFGENTEIRTNYNHGIILSVCWRSMKEASELLAQVVKIAVTALLNGRSDTPGFQLLTYEELMEIGKLFGQWMLEIRHRGAFSAIHASYSALCNVLCSLPSDSSLSDMPYTWLQGHIDAITNRKICTTRRSAGLPYCILSTCQSLSLSKHSLLRTSINQIFDLAEREKISPESQVHLLNTLKILHTDSKVSSKTTSLFFERSYDFAIKSFVSSDWRVRNGALILFSGLTNRVFGTRAFSSNRSHSLLCKRETFLDFFQRLPRLHSVLLSELKRSIDAQLHATAEASLQGPLFAVLSLFALLQNPDSTPAADDFTPLVWECLQSKVSKIRSMAAEALTGLLPLNQIPSLICQLLKDASVLRFHNKLHGTFLLINRLVQVPTTLSLLEKSKIVTQLEVCAKTFVLSNQSLPHVCKSKFLDVLESLESRFDIHLSFLLGADLISLLKITDESDTIKAKAPGTCSLEAKMVNYFLIKSASPELISSLLSLGSPSVMKSALMVIEKNVKEDLLNNPHVKSSILSLARDQRLPVQIRIVPLDFFAKKRIRFQTSDWLFDEIYQEYESTRVITLRDQLLKILALAITSSLELDDRKYDVELQTTRLINGLFKASFENQSIETRKSAAESLIILSEAYSSLSVENSIAFINVALTLVQDDDDDIRTLLLHGLAGNCKIMSSIPVVPVLAFEKLSTLAHNLSKHFILERLLDPSAIQTDLDQLRNPSRLLFATERFNLYRDEMLEIRFLEKLSRSEQKLNKKDEVKEVPTEKLARFKELLSNMKEYDDMHFTFKNLLECSKDNNLTCQRAWNVLANKITSAFDNLQNYYGYNMFDESEIKQVEQYKLRVRTT